MPSARFTCSARGWAHVGIFMRVRQVLYEGRTRVGNEKYMTSNHARRSHRQAGMFLTHPTMSSCSALTGSQCRVQGCISIRVQRRRVTRRGAESVEGSEVGDSDALTLFGLTSSRMKHGSLVLCYARTSLKFETNYSHHWASRQCTANT